MAAIEEVIDGQTGDEIRVAINNSLNNLNADKLEKADYISRNKKFVQTTTSGEGSITLSGEQTLNGLLTSGSRVLVMEQSAGADNGIYLSAAGAWTRSTDADTSSKVLNGMQTQTDDSNTRNSHYILSTADPIILGTTVLIFDELSGNHNLGGPEHSTDSLANLNTKVSDATLLSETAILAITGAISAGIDNKAFCDTSTEGVGNITLSGEQTLNGLLTSTSRVLVTEQTVGEDNGFYTTAAGAWSRTTDADEDDEVTNGVSTLIDNSGSDVYRHHYLLTTADPITVGTTPLVFAVLPDIAFGTTTGTATEGNDSRLLVDKQEASATGTTSTTSATYLDLDTMTLTTSNTSSKRYTVSFGCNFANSTKVLIGFILSVNGATVASSERMFMMNTNGTVAVEPIIMFTQTLTAAIGTGLVIKVQYKTAGGTLEVSNRSLIIDGID